MKTMAMCMVAAWTLVLGGCTASTSGTGTANDTPGQDGGTTNGGGTSCQEIVQCTDPCAEDDDACINACIAKGSPNAQTAATALKDCIRSNACRDNACLEAKCSAQMNACMQDGASAQPAAAGATGSVPSDLVGSWDHNGTLIAFRGDGTVHRQEAPYNGCSQGYEDGTAVASGSSLTLSFTSGMLLVCGNPSGEAYMPTVEHYTYMIENHPDGANGPYTVLTLTNTDCDPGTTVCALGYDRVN